jgi:hypothetical protein
MPLVKGASARTRKGFSENIKREMHEGKPQKQAVAIAYSEADRGKKMKKQSHKDKMDESLGERHGKESSHKQSMKARRHESESMKKEHHHKKK